MEKFEHPISGETFFVAKNDFPEKMNVETAADACRSLGEKWRLPSPMELQAIFEQLHQNKLGDFKDGEEYWTNNWRRAGPVSGRVFRFDANPMMNGNREGMEAYYVRAIKPC